MLDFGRGRKVFRILILVIAVAVLNLPKAITPDHPLYDVGVLVAVVGIWMVALHFPREMAGKTIMIMFLAGISTSLLAFRLFLQPGCIKQADASDLLALLLPYGLAMSAGLVGSLMGTIIAWPASRNPVVTLAVSLPMGFGAGWLVAGVICG